MKRFISKNKFNDPKESWLRFHVHICMHSHNEKLDCIKRSRVNMQDLTSIISKKNLPKENL